MLMIGVPLLLFTNEMCVGKYPCRFSFEHMGEIAYFNTNFETILNKLKYSYVKKKIYNFLGADQMLSGGDLNHEEHTRKKLQ